MLLIIGLDGATWNLLDPWIEQGHLPNLARLKRNGAWGELSSTIPAATFPSWTSLMTGVNPGKHGIFDFTRRELGTYSVRFVNASFRKAPTVWQLLSEVGQRVCVLGLPGTYPPERINGVMVSGFDTPVTTRADASFIWPPSLAASVMKSGGFPFADFQEFRIGPGWYELALDRLLRGVELKTRLAQTLLRRERWDCFLLLFGESDTVAHHFWHFHDLRSPRAAGDPGVRLRTAIRRVYEALDAAIGTLMETAGDATVVIASDHGFGGAGTKVLYLNRWLRQQGFQKATEQGSEARLATAFKRWALRCIPPQLQARAFRLNGGRWAARLESRSRFAGIDWTGTRAFSEELNYFPSIWINLKGREPQGTVNPEDYDRTRDDVCAALRELRDLQHGEPVVRHAWRREEVYSGPWVQHAPDIVLELALDQGYSYTCLPSASSPHANAMAVLANGEVAAGKLTGMNGSHRPEGVFLLGGPGVVSSGVLSGVKIADMAPTILSLCGVEPRAEFDGRTVSAVVRPNSGSVVAGPRRDDSEQLYGDAEEREIAARLSSLGYLE